MDSPVEPANDVEGEFEAIKTSVRILRQWYPVRLPAD
jgi:hypothetical protein